MKTNTIIIVFLLLASLLCGCGTKNIAGPVSDKEISSLEGLSLTLDSVSKNGAEYTVANNTDIPAQCGTGADCRLEVELDGTWYELVQKGDSPMTMELYACTAGEPLTQSVDWSARYGALPAGHYRLLKNVWLEDSEWLAAEFSVK